MRLLTKDLEKKFEEYPLYSQDGKMGDAKVIAKFYIPVVSTLQQRCIWLITEGELEFNEVPDLFKPKMINYSIYQLNDKESNHFLRFEPIKRLKNGIADIKAENYEKVYEGKYADFDMQDNEKVISAVEKIFMKFNSDELMPSDFKGHSLSVSDIVVFENDGFSKAYYIDRVGIKEIPSFPEQLKEEKIINLAKRIMKDKVPKDVDPMAYDLTKVVTMGYAQNLHSIEGCKEVLEELKDCIETKRKDMEINRYEGNFSKESEYETEELITEYQSICNEITALINEIQENEQIKNEPDITDEM